MRAGKFMPMVGLFFMLAFVNTILDSLKDTLVITATGGGAQVGGVRLVDRGFAWGRTPSSPWLVNSLWVSSRSSEWADAITLLQWPWAFLPLMYMPTQDSKPALFLSVDLFAHHTHHHSLSL
jgi:hypothetical protein